MPITYIQEEMLSRHDIIDSSIVTCRWCSSDNCVIRTASNIDSDVPRAVRVKIEFNLKHGDVLYFCLDCKRYFTTMEPALTCDSCGKLLGRKRFYISGVNSCVYCSMECVTYSLNSVFHIVFHKDTYYEELAQQEKCDICKENTPPRYSEAGKFFHLSCMQGSKERFLILDTPLTNYTGD